MTPTFGSMPGGFAYAGNVYPGFPTKPPQPQLPGALATPASFGASSPRVPQAPVLAPPPADDQGGLSAIMAQPAAKHGFAGFLDRMLNPAADNALGQLGRALVIAGGTPLGTAYQYLDEQHQRAAENDRERLKDQREVAWHNQSRQDHQDEVQWERTKPQYFSGNEDRIEFDPTTGTTRTLFDAPTDAQTYANNLGLQAGTPEYNRAMQDYVLRSSGPTAYEYRGGLEDQRYSNRVRLKGVPTYRDTHRPPGGVPRAGGGGHRTLTLAGTIAPIIAKVARGEQLTPGEQQAYAMYHPGRGGGGGAKRTWSEGDTVSYPDGSRKTLRGGQWVPAK